MSSITSVKVNVNVDVAAILKGVAAILSRALAFAIVFTG